jgi:hypothetical protein
VPARETAPSADFALIQGIRDTRRALDRWEADPGPVLRAWFGWSTMVALALLAAVWLVSMLARSDPTSIFIPGLSDRPGLSDYARILSSNLLVLALHATACVAGFIAGSSLRHTTPQRSGLLRLIHEKAGPIAIGWVVLVITFSLVAQALILGSDGASLAAQLGIPSLLLIVTVLPHALLELTAVFLPFGAWLIAGRRGEWSDLLAATLVTVALALPMLLVAALIELYVWPELLLAASPKLT